MEETFLGIFKDIVSSGAISPDNILLLELTALAAVSYYFLRPMYEKMKTLITKEEIVEILEKRVHDETTEIENYIAQTVKDETRQLEDIINRLERLYDRIESIDENEKSSYKEMKEIRRDIESVKQILNQFQGHMLYGRRATDFTNQELK